MFSLTERSPDLYKWEGVEIELNLSFDNILVFLKMFGDETLHMERRLRIGVNMLVCDQSVLQAISDHGKLMDFALDLFRDKLNLRIREEDQIKVKAESNKSKEEEQDEPVPVFDWEEDAELIYSSFLFDYGIDLIEQQGKLTWDRFYALFNNLSEDSKMGQALHYRSCAVPKKEKGNEEERKRIMKMKEFYMLEKAKPIIERNQFRQHQREMEARKKALMEQQQKE